MIREDLWTCIFEKKRVGQNLTEIKIQMIWLRNDA